MEFWRDIIKDVRIVRADSLTAYFKVIHDNQGAFHNRSAFHIKVIIGVYQTFDYIGIAVGFVTETGFVWLAEIGIEITFTQICIGLDPQFAVVMVNQQGGVVGPGRLPVNGSVYKNLVVTGTPDNESADDPAILNNQT